MLKQALLLRFSFQICDFLLNKEEAPVLYSYMLVLCFSQEKEKKS